MKRTFPGWRCIGVLLCSVIICSGDGPHAGERPAIGLLQGIMAGEVTRSSAILQSRLTATQKSLEGDVPGAPGQAKFQLSTDPAFDDARETRWLKALPGSDHIVKTKVSGLSPGTRYYYRLLYGKDREHVNRGPLGSFRTLPAKGAREEISFAVVTGMNYYRFHDGEKAYKGPDKSLGYPALQEITELAPDFVVFTGDNVYYDHGDRAMTERELRSKWHEQFVQKRFKKLFSRVPGFWEKDDHDYRYNDCDNTGIIPPSPALGRSVFKEQAPVTDPEVPDDLTYRTHRAGDLLQVWLLEGRDYRHPNLMPDCRHKSLWGDKQKKWLKRTLLASDADFKIIISPTPMIGPDDRYKRDNHTNPHGFRHEGERFFEWARQEGFLEKGLVIICGDRHWQYHSIHPSGFQEFSCGALVDANSRIGIKPGDPQGTDPRGRIRQPYTSEEPSGGFLLVKVEPKADRALISFNFHDERGRILYKKTLKAQ